ncbi:uncharacterized protein BT62DRAFT_1081128 [Guyanagaster necrorhizus]|uniref:Uncharacterized protein n=1 Tax=Guyanagaster necrorhizus TaxID=856835 RepID=A0A9P7VGK3_9AGAR|nr:uncharacterized protein BT62DRAFT_1081128 [Guyanagaster necrorhizus MCA 3950]KAG7440168.1 hypothetical protein BT62DRAFT_1081128 [Guyanagaster necrorhizus MCA 3950]
MPVSSSTLTSAGLLVFLAVNPYPDQRRHCDWERLASVNVHFHWLNIWTLNFIPEGGKELLPESIAAFRKSICPGRHLSVSNAWIVFASTLLVLTFSKTNDSDGKVIELSDIFTNAGDFRRILSF